MIDPKITKSDAVALAGRLLTQRLKSAGIQTGSPEIYFQCQADQPQPFPGGFQVRVHTWRHWSDALVELDADSGERARWTIDRCADPASETELSQAEALLIAQQAINIPPGAELESFQHTYFAAGHKVAELQWRHMHDRLRVDGDYLSVSIHPQTKRIIEWACKWRQVRLNPKSRSVWQALGLKRSRPNQ